MANICRKQTIKFESYFSPSFLGQIFQTVYLDFHTGRIRKHLKVPTGNLKPVYKPCYQNSEVSQLFSLLLKYLVLTLDYKSSSNRLSR